MYSMYFHQRIMIVLFFVKENEYIWWGWLKYGEMNVIM